TMIDAIETVRRAVARARPRTGRVRLLALAAAIVGSVALTTWWLPEALVSHAVAVLPEPTRAEIGGEVVEALARVSAAPCRAPQADRALADLAAMLTPQSRFAKIRATRSDVAARAEPALWARGGAWPGIVVLPDGVEGARFLPGGIVLVGRSLVEDFETPEVLAGHLLEADLRADVSPPLGAVLRAAGPFATAQVLTTGHLPGGALDRYAEALMTGEESPVDEAALLARFAEARLSTAPFAYARDVTGETVLSLIEADPMRGKEARPLMRPADWAALQEICAARD
ncbi:MAG: hypothetical protein AAGB05_02530, partial [Pseudomonadota bacterium]